MNIDLSHKTVLINGASQGIGKACAIELASLNANVIIVARNEENLKQTLSELKGMGKHSYIVADVEKLEDLENKIREYLKNNTVNILINNSGGPPAGPISTAKAEEFTKAFSNHLLCNHLLAGLVIPGMKESKYGRIINIISTSVKIPLKGLGVSNTIRAAVANWSKTLSNELAPFGITVNNVLPGATLTGRLSSIIENKAQKTAHSVDAVTEEMINEIPMQRFAEPSEIAAAVAFFASPAASYVTGTNMPVDGGRTGSL